MLAFFLADLINHVIIFIDEGVHVTLIVIDIEKFLYTENDTRYA